MAKDKVTIQDIADALGISRNTASKALNGNSSLPAETRNRVIKKAIELKYKQFAFIDTETVASKTTGNIALFTSNMPGSSHFGSRLLSGLEEKISSEGYNLSIHFVREAETAAMELPVNFEPAKADGIICIEMFDKAYSEMVTGLGIPVIFIDASAELDFSELQADVMLMENEHSVASVTKALVRDGHTRIGFVGDYMHCRSFNERWAGFNRAMAESKLPVDPSICIVDDDRFFFHSEPGWMENQLNRMDPPPTAFVCANDFIAVALIRALKNRDLRIPEDLVVVGFDDAPEAQIVDPQLTTIHIFSHDMGLLTAELLLARIKNPSRPFQIVHVKTEPVYRASSKASSQAKQASASAR